MIDSSKKTFSENFRFQTNCIKLDFFTYLKFKGSSNFLRTVLYFLTCHGWHIMLFFRIGKIIYSTRIPIISHIVKIIFQFFWFLLTTFYGIWIDLTCDIGSEFYIGHFGSIIIRGKIGRNCSLGQGVTIGSKGAGKSNGWPVIGDNVYIGAGAKIIGNIKIGSNVRIGANSVVIDDIPDNSLVVGIPGKIKALIKE